MTFSVFFPFFGLSLHSNESNPCNQSSHLTPIATPPGTEEKLKSVNEMPVCQAPSPLLYTVVRVEELTHNLIMQLMMRCEPGSTPFGALPLILCFGLTINP